MTDDVVTDNPQGRINDILMAKNMAELLHRHYPGHLWAVSCDGKFADVRNMMLSGNWGWRVKVSGLSSGSDFDKKIVRAGGELLERYRLTRGKFNEDHVATLPTDFAGRLIGDKT